jgi:hypothetical protein
MVCGPVLSVKCEVRYIYLTSQFREETPPADELIGHNLFTQRNAISGVYGDDRMTMKGSMGNFTRERGLLDIERKSRE